MRRGPLLLSAAVWLLALLPEALEAQCPMCRTALSSPEGQAMAQSFNRAILLLLAAPFSLVGTVAVLIWRAGRAQRSDRADPASPAPATDDVCHSGAAPSWHLRVRKTGSW